MPDANSETTSTLISNSQVESDGSTSHIPRSLETAFDYMQHIDWQKKLDNLDQVYGASEKVETIIAAEQFLHLPKEQIQLYVVKAVKKEADSAEKNAIIYKQKSESDSQDRLHEINYKSNLIYAEGYKSELKKMEADPEYAYAWYVKQRDVITAAKVDIQRKAEEIDQRTEQFFKPYRVKPWVSLKGRIVPLNEIEYKSYIYNRYGNNDHGSEIATYTNGQTTFPHSQEARAAVVKLKTNIQLKDELKPDEGVVLVVESAAADSIADHEAIHLITDLSRDEEVNESSGTKLIIDRRGFRERYLDESGVYKEVSPNEKDFAFEALDEGTVVFFERYLNYGQDLDKVIESLNKPYQRLSKGYIQAALAIAGVVKEIGITSLATNYINSNPFQFKKDARQKLGAERSAIFMQEIRVAEANLKS